MKLKVYYNNWLPKLLNVYAITLYPFILFATSIEEATNSTLIAHEVIHVRQIRKLGFLKFYFDYWFQYYRNRLKGQNADSAYESITYEKEAYDNEQIVELTNEEIKEFNGNI